MMDHGFTRMGQASTAAPNKRDAKERICQLMMEAIRQKAGKYDDMTDQDDVLIFTRCQLHLSRLFQASGVLMFRGEATSRTRVFADIVGLRYIAVQGR